MKAFLLAALIALSGTAFAQQTPSAYEDALRAYKSGQFSTAKKLFLLVPKDDPKSQAAKVYLQAIALKQEGGGNADLETSLKMIQIAKVSFTDAAAKDAMNYVGQQVEKETGGKQKLNIVWMVPEGKARPVTLALENIPATEALRYIADTAGLQLAYDAFAVKVTPAATQ
jgi:hypothetical protein